MIHTFRVVMEVETDAPADMAAEAMACHVDQPIFRYEIKDASETANVYVSTVHIKGVDW